MGENSNLCATAKHNLAPCADLEPRRRKQTKPNETYAISLPLARGVHCPLQEIPGNMQCLPSMPFKIRDMTFPFSSGLPIFQFCGEEFVKLFVMHDHEDYSILFNAFLLL